MLVLRISRRSLSLAPRNAIRVRAADLDAARQQPDLGPGRQEAAVARGHTLPVVRVPGPGQQRQERGSGTGFACFLWIKHAFLHGLLPKHCVHGLAFSSLAALAPRMLVLRISRRSLRSLLEMRLLLSASRLP